MSRLLIILLLTVAALAITTEGKGQTKDAENREKPTTTWRGALNIGGNTMRLELDVTGKGQSLVAILRSVDQGNVKLQTDKLIFNGEQLSFRVPKIQATFSGELDDDGTVAKGTFSQNGRQFPLEMKKLKETTDPSTETLKEAWVGKLNVGTIELVMQFRVVVLDSGETKVYFDSVTEGPGGFPGTWSVEDHELKFDIEAIKLSYRGKLNSNRDVAEGTWSQGGRELPLKLTKQLIEYKSEFVWENRPQRPVAPFPYETEEVKFVGGADDVVLSGTLTIPQADGRHPAVILISGSGPSDRDESIMEHKPFLVLADYLTRQGVAVLRYDDRGTAKSTGDFANATTEDFAEDASGAVDFLKQHSRINPQQIGLVGHSEGGLIAPLTENSRNDIALIVLLAATGVNGREISISQTEAMLQAAGVSSEELAISSKLSTRVLEQAVKPLLAADLETEIKRIIEDVAQTLPESNQEQFRKNSRASFVDQIPRLQSPWMQYFLKHDPTVPLKKIKCPVLAIIGTKDLQVVPELNVPPLKTALKNNRDVKVVVLEGLNHLFQKCETGAMTEYRSIQETFNPVALQTIGDWIRLHVDSPK